MAQLFDLEFLKKLKQKSKTGNLGSIHLNVLPGRFATRLDLASLNDASKNLAENFIQSLLNQSKFKFDISLQDIDPNKFGENQRQKLGLISKRLNSIVYENTDNYLEHGIKTFGFGYPVLIKRYRSDPSKVIKVPILIWSLDIERSKTKSNSWTIIRDVDYPVSINEVFISHLESDEGVKIERLSEDFLEDSKIDEHELLEICANILSQLHPESSSSLMETFEQKFKLPIEKIADKESIESITKNFPWILWSGVFGLYRMQKESIIKDLDNLIENFEQFKSEELKIERFQTTSIASVDTDPSQQEVLNSFSNSPNKIIQGPPGTGKSQSLTALISNALANKAKCLVVCEKKTALDVIYENLRKIGLSELAVIIEDTTKDRRSVVDSVRERLDENLFSDISSIESNSDFSSKDALLENIKQSITDIQKCHSKLAESLFDGYNWTALVGKFMALNETCNENPLINRLKPNEFKFNTDEYNRIERIFHEAQIYYQTLGSVTHTLEFLRDDLFNEENPNTLKTKIEGELHRFSEDLSYFISCRDNIFKSEHVNYLGYIKNNPLKGFLLARKIKKKVEPYRLKNNYLIQSFSPVAKASLGLLSGIGLKKFKNASYNKGKALDYYHKLTFFFENHGMKFSFKDTNSEFSLSDIATNIDDLLKLYVNLVKEKMVDFRIFYQWKHLFLSLDELQRKVLIALIICGMENWKDYFQHWYFHCILTQNEDGNLPVNDIKIRSLSNDLEKAKKLQIKDTLQYWRQEQNASAQKFNARSSILTVKNLYNKRGGRGQRRNSLRKILKTDFNLFTNYFPVLLLNPSVCSSLIPLKKGISDLVIFDEASQLRLEETYPALFRGKYIVVSGDSQQMPPSSFFQANKIVFDDDADFDEELDESDEEDVSRRNTDGILNLAESESLLEFAENVGYKESFLKIHYRSQHPYLIDFSNAAFYGNQLNPMPASQDYKPIRFIEVNGTYKNHINEGEAEQVLNILLNAIKPKEDDTCPSVGIATFNIFQRNFILEKINEEQQKSKESAEKIQKLFDAGLFVKNLENIQGDERDIMILSITFGPKEDGMFSQKFGPIIQKNGYRLLNVIITRAKQKVYVCCSIPVQYYNQYRELIPLKGNTGKQIIYAYLAYAKAIENNDEETRESILGLLLDSGSSKYNGQSVPAEGTESPFEDEVYAYLARHIDPNRIEVQYKCAGFRIDMIVKSEIDNKPIIAIECDGASYHSSNEAYAWDMFRQKHLESYGFKFHRIWSTNWWHNPEEETTKMVKFINMIDDTEIQRAETETQTHYNVLEEV